MSKVRRWYIGVYGGDAQARTTSSSEFEIIHERSGQYFVLDEDFDRVVAERDALQLGLNAADQRLDDLVSAVRSINHAKRHEVFVPGDDEPQYRQRKEWVDWVLSLCDEASASEPCHEIPGTSAMRLNMLANQGE